MAKVTDFKFDINGQNYIVHVNCNSSGQFSANLPDAVSDALRITAQLTAPTLEKLSTTFNDAIKAYKTRETKQELFILMAYYARGNYAKYKSGNILFGGHGHKYHLDVSFSKPQNAIGLDFFVAVKETIDGKPIWYKAKLGSECSYIQDQSKEPDKWHKMEKVYHPDDYKAIPFSEAALQSLNNANEKIRAASETLFHFIEQDEIQIEYLLTNQKLLN